MAVITNLTFRLGEMKIGIFRGGFSNAFRKQVYSKETEDYRCAKVIGHEVGVKFPQE